MHDLETLAAQVALKRLAGERSVAATARQQGNSFRSYVLGMHATCRDLEALPPTKGNWGIIAGDGDFAAQDKCLGIEIMTMIGRDQVGRHAAVYDAIALP